MAAAEGKGVRGMADTKILIVEDDADINQILTRIMKSQGYEAVSAFSGSEARLRLFADREEGGMSKEYDLILLDLMLPGVMGEDLIREIREKSDVPLIVVSAKTALEDKVQVLNAGADDYLTKPFEKEEVIARVNGALRRYRRFMGSTDTDAGNGESKMLQGGAVTEDGGQQPLSYKNLSLYPEAREVKVCGQLLSLTGHEFDILYLLLQNPSKVYSRESLYEQVWRGGYYGEDNTVNVHVSNLRKKIAAADGEEYIKTVWGIGFKMA